MNDMKKESRVTITAQSTTNIVLWNSDNQILLGAVDPRGVGVALLNRDQAVDLVEAIIDLAGIEEEIRALLDS